MSQFDHVMARRLERLCKRRRTKSGAPGGVVTVHKQHIRGDRWWRMRFAELVERRREASP